MKATTRVGLVLILVGLAAALSFTGLAGADGGGPNGSARPPATGWVTGNSVGDGFGVIIHTTDGGQTWVRQGKAGEIPDVELGGNAVSAIDAQNAWVVGEGVILRTRSGGRTWQRQELPAEASDASLLAVYAVDGKTAWAAGGQGVILHTTDGGRTWTRQGQGTAPVVDLNGVYASDAEHAWVVGDGETDAGSKYKCGTILRTSDGGITWEKMLYELSEPCDSAKGLLSVHGSDASTLWAVGSGQAVHSTDGGLTWLDQTPGPGIADHNGVFAADRNTVWVVTDFGGIYRSDDGGVNWEKQLPPQCAIDDWILRISGVDGQTAWATTGPSVGLSPGHVLHTADGGQTWIAQTTPEDPWFWGVSFVSPPPPPPEPPPPETPFVPEASTLLLLGSGLTGLAGYAGLQWRARRKN